MKVQIICEHCGKVVELKPQDNGNHSYMQKPLNDSNFYISDIDIDHELDGDLEEVNDLDDIDVNTTLKEIRITCRNCGNYIVLTEFE